MSAAVRRKVLATATSSHANAGALTTNIAGAPCGDARVASQDAQMAQLFAMISVLNRTARTEDAYKGALRTASPSRDPRSFLQVAIYAGIPPASIRSGSRAKRSPSRESA